MRKPSIFIGSATAGLPVASGVKELLSGDAEITLWDSGVFRVGAHTLESLLECLHVFEFAILVLADSTPKGRRGNSATGRDNVLFEIGLFMGALGQKRTFVVCSREAQLAIPSDLSGITFAAYDEPASGDSDVLIRALTPAVEQIRRAIVAGVDRYEVDFLKAYLTFVGPRITLSQTYSGIITDQYDRIRTAVRQLEKRQDWDALLAVKERLGEYFEYQARYSEGVEFGEIYRRALEEQGKTLEALWMKVKHVAYFLILAGRHDAGRQKLAEARAALTLMTPSEGIRECLYYCYRYEGISYMRDDVIDDKRYAHEHARQCFEKAEDLANTFVDRKFDELHARLLGNWGNLALVEKDAATALSKYQESLSLFRGLDDKEHIGIALLKIAEAQLEARARPETVVALLDNAESIFINLGWMEGQGRVMQQRARIFELLAESAASEKGRHEYFGNCVRCARSAKLMFGRIGLHRLSGQVEGILTRVLSQYKDVPA